MSLRDKIKEIVKKHLKETSATGTGSGFTAGSGVNYATPFAFNPKKGAKGAEHIYYYKLGYKPVNKKALNKKAKGIEVKQLWEEENPHFDIESYLSSLQTDDETKKYIAGKLGDFNILASKLKELITLIGKAKNESINSYRDNPQMRSIYGTDLASSMLDDIIELFKD
jgi:hypothetical protein